MLRGMRGHEAISRLRTRPLRSDAMIAGMSCSAHDCRDEAERKLENLQGRTLARIQQNPNKAGNNKLS